MSAMPISDAWLREFRNREHVLAGADVPWLRRLRAEAVETFRETGFPTLRQEDWKYTDTRPIVQHNFRITDATDTAMPDAAVVHSRALFTRQLVFVDGTFVPALSTPVSPRDGVHILSLAAAIRHIPGKIEPWLGRIAPAGENGFAALNAAFLQDGAVVHLARGAAPEEPLELLFLTSNSVDALSYVRNLIVLEAGSRASIIENHVALENVVGLTNSVTEIALESGAQLDHCRVGLESAAAYHIGSAHARLARDSRYRCHSIAFGGRIVRHALDVSLDEDGAECTLDGLTAARGRQHIDHQTRIDHRRPHGTSREYYKGVLDDQSRVVFSGRIVVHPQAQHADAAQANHNLLLSDGAEADSRPQLEIYADDVKCAHGATVGSLDQEALFYLRSRGVGAADASRLLVHAFANDILARIPFDGLRTRLEELLAERLMSRSPRRHAP
jgi:Fe-S cluster assembly protein SufD